MKQMDQTTDKGAVAMPSWPHEPGAGDRVETPFYLEGNYPVPDTGQSTRLASESVTRDEHIVVDPNTCGVMLDHLQRMETGVVAFRAALLSAKATSDALHTARQRGRAVFEEPVPCADGYCGA